MAEAGVAPGAVIDDAEGENLGADQEIPQQQAQGEVVVNIMNRVLIWIGFDVVANRQALCSEIAEIKDMVDLTEKDITSCRSRIRSVHRTLAECILDSSVPNNSRPRCTGYRTLLESVKFLHSKD